MANGQYDNTNRGALFRNKRKQPGDNKPDYTGKIDIDGIEYMISGWVKKSNHSGETFLSLARQLNDQQPRQQQRPPVQPPAQEPLKDDDIPF